MIRKRKFNKDPNTENEQFRQELAAIKAELAIMRGATPPTWYAIDKDTYIDPVQGEVTINHPGTHPVATSLDGATYYHDGQWRSFNRAADQGAYASIVGGGTGTTVPSGSFGNAHFTSNAEEDAFASPSQSDIEVKIARVSQGGYCIYLNNPGVYLVQHRTAIDEDAIAAGEFVSVSLAVVTHPSFNPETGDQEANFTGHPHVYGSGASEDSTLFYSMIVVVVETEQVGDNGVGPYADLCPVGIVPTFGGGGLTSSLELGPSQIWATKIASLPEGIFFN